MDDIFRAVKPSLNEQAVNYKNPTGVKRGRNRIILSVGCVCIAGLLVGTGVYYTLSQNLALGIVLFCCAAVYVFGCVVYVIDAARLLKRPYAVLIDDRYLILREKNDYLHLPLNMMRRLTIDCEGIEAQLVVNANGGYDVLIKGDTLYYTVEKEQNTIGSKYMRKIAFILNCLAIASDDKINYGERYDELLASEHVEAEGAAAGLNKELDELYRKSQENEKTETDGGGTQ